VDDVDGREFARSSDEPLECHLRTPRFSGGHEDIHTTTHSPNGEFRHRTSAAGVLIAPTANVRARYRAKRHIYTDPNANP
jgi:hypothetical protein